MLKIKDSLRAGDGSACPLLIRTNRLGPLRFSLIPHTGGPWVTNKIGTVVLFLSQICGKRSISAMVRDDRQGGEEEDRGRHRRAADSSV